MADRAVAIMGLTVLAWLIAPTCTGAQTIPACAPASDPICRTIGSSEFAAAYRNAAAGGLDPEDAVDDVRANLRRAMLGAGQAGPGAIGQQIDAVLDDALRRAQRQMCGAGRLARGCNCRRIVGGGGRARDPARQFDARFHDRCRGRRRRTARDRLPVRRA